eukprot:scaffold1186_cov211-Chaetoceros_neogracile.AAC.4
MNQLSILFICLIAAFCHAEFLSNGEEVSAYVAEHISQHDVVIFSKSYCPYCTQTKGTFQRLLGDLGFGDNLSFKVIELDELPQNDGGIIQRELYEISGQRTVPNVFIRGMHIGGNSDVQDLLRREELATMIDHYN